MSKQHNYRNYSNPNNNVNPVTPAAEEVEEQVEETIVGENAEEVTEEVVEEPVEETVNQGPEQVIGLVICSKLNVRKLPNPNGQVLCVITEGTEVQIDLDESTVDWYKVCTNAGVSGYCMKKFIAAR